MSDRSATSSLTDAADTEARYRELFAALREPILLTSDDGRIAGFNAAALSLFGGPARLYGRPIEELLPFILLAAGGADNATWEGQLADANGQSRVVEVSRTRLGDGQLSIEDLYVVHDVSRYVEVNRLREELLYAVAHELRDPLAVLDNSLSILATEHGDLSVSEFDHVLSSARRSAAGLRDLMDNLLSAGRIQSGRFHVRPRPLELSAVIDEALVAVQPMLDAREQRIERKVGPGACRVLADPTYTRQVMTHLLRNASKYGPEREPVRIRAECTNGCVRVTVEDRGPGIAPEQQAGLFERFYRVRPGYDEPGIGLGLAIAKGIIEAHGGSIGVESQMGVGTSIWFTLPRAKEPGT